MRFLISTVNPVKGLKRYSRDMKAAVNYTYGPPDVIEVKDVPVPVPKDNEVLIRVHAATVNRTDTGMRSAAYFVSRFFTGLLKPTRPIGGSEFAGEVVEVGSAVRDFRVGTGCLDLMTSALVRTRST